MIFVDNNKNPRPNEVVQFDSNLIYYCAHCRDASKLSSWAYMSVEDVHSHWILIHSNSPIPRPFHFYAVELVSCLHCRLMSSFEEIKNHQKLVHPDEPLVITNVLNLRKCGLCDYTNDDLAQHLKTEHELVLRMDAFNPTRFSQDILNQLLYTTIHKKFKCKYCDVMFETRLDIQNHTCTEQKMPLSFKMVPDQLTVKIVAECCQSVLYLEDFLEHVATSNHPFPGTCSKCTFQTTDLYEYVNHQVEVHQMAKSADEMFRRLLQTRFWSTKVIFGNGLVLSKHNLLGTEFDDSKPFEWVINSLLDNARAKLHAKNLC